MINYAINRETKTIELLSGEASMQEIKDLIKLFKDYKFTVSLPFPLKNTLEKQGISVGAAYVSIVGKIEHS